MVANCHLWFLECECCDLSFHFHLSKHLPNLMPKCTSTVVKNHVLCQLCSKRLSGWKYGCTPLKLKRNQLCKIWSTIQRLTYSVNSLKLIRWFWTTYLCGILQCLLTLSVCMAFCPAYLTYPWWIYVAGSSCDVLWRYWSSVQWSCSNCGLSQPSGHHSESLLPKKWHRRFPGSSHTGILRYTWCYLWIIFHLSAAVWTIKRLSLWNCWIDNLQHGRLVKIHAYLIKKLGEICSLSSVSHCVSYVRLVQLVVRPYSSCTHRILWSYSRITRVYSGRSY